MISVKIYTDNSWQSSSEQELRTRTADTAAQNKDSVLEFRVQVQSEETVSMIDDISETKVLKDTEIDSLFVFKP